MGFIDFIQQAVVSIFIAYIGFTNSLAIHLENFFLGDLVQTNRVADTVDTSFKKIVTGAEKFTDTIPRVLLENQSFQRAAIHASTQDTDIINTPSTTPIETVIAHALVNIYCQYKTDEFIRTTTGTGFFINQKGVILTNAHVAQFLLLEDVHDVIHDVECVIRTGNPAEPKYKAKLLYISPTWIYENAHLIDTETPRGTGERDYALLYISDTTDHTPLPTRFPSIQINTNLLARSVEGTLVYDAGYPAEKLIQYGSDTELAPVIAQASIGTLYTFGSNYADIFSISESPVGEHGASGGPVIHKDDDTVIGVIVTKGDLATEGEKSLRALTLSYINRTITEETGFSLTQNMQGDVALRGRVFKEAIGPFLTGLLTDELKHTLNGN